MVRRSSRQLSVSEGPCGGIYTQLPDNAADGHNPDQQESDNRGRKIPPATRRSVPAIANNSPEELTNSATGNASGAPCQKGARAQPFVNFHVSGAFRSRLGRRLSPSAAAPTRPNRTARPSRTVPVEARAKRATRNPMRFMPVADPELEEAPETENDFFARDWEVPAHAHATPVLLVAAMTAIWALGLPARSPGTWILSWTQLSRGSVLPLAGYMFAHVSLVHLALNAVALLALGGPLVACLGRGSVGWARFLYLYLGSGISGGLAFVVAHPDHSPVVGASGAIFGVLGALARVHPATGGLVPIGSRRTWMMTKFFLGNHAALFAIAAVAAVITGQAQSLAWEAHLGGLLFGFFAAPLFLDRAPAPLSHRQP